MTDVRYADAHVDLAWNALALDRDLEARALTVRTHELGTVGEGRAGAMLSWPDLAAGGVHLAVATLRAPVERVPVPHRSYASAAQAHAVARGHLAYYRAVERRGLVRIVTEAAHLPPARGPAVDADGAGGRVALVLALTCADPVLDAADLVRWHDAGVRVLGLAHPGAGRHAGGYGTHAGLAEGARPLLDAAAALGLVLDLADASEASFDEAAGRWRGPVMVSHGTSRARAPVLGSLDDGRIRAIADRGGVLGITLRSSRLNPPNATGRASLDRLVDHVEHVAQLTGDVAAVAIGSDLDDPAGREDAVEGIETVADLPRLAEALARRGFGDADVHGVMGGNLIRFLTRALEGER